MRAELFSLGGMPALRWGRPSRQGILYLHGQGGSKAEAAFFAAAAADAGWQTVSVDLPGHGDRESEAAALVPWQVVPELRCALAELRVSEERLAREGRIPTTFGQTLSWEYLRYVRTHPARRWRTPTAILYGARDHLTDRETVEAFAARNGCRLTVEEAGEHWFHTPEQLAVVDRWQRACLADLE